MNREGERIEWAIQTDDDVRPVHYALRGTDPAAEEEWHRHRAQRPGTKLFRRTITIGPWEEVPDA